MEALSRLRILIWLVLFSLWAVMLYQFMGEEDEQERMQALPSVHMAMLPHAPEDPQIPEFSGGLVAIAPAPPPRAAPKPRRRSTPILRDDKSPTRKEMPAAPPGFVQTQSRHFTVYSEDLPASDDFLNLLESLHGNLMLDLAAFSPWARDEKVTIILFHDQKTYQSVTGRPAWSAGASSVSKRKIYLFASPEMTGILAHELCHIFYDGFFIGGTPDPLWLSEGMATVIQVERGLAAPNWLHEHLQPLQNNKGFSVEQLVNVKTTSAMTDDSVQLWYTQSYSIVRFLMRMQGRTSFYHFSQYIREGKPPAEALYRAYGMPYNRLKALEYAWRYAITHG